MARAAFLILALANLAFFAWAEGYLGPVDDGREPARLREQLQPERLRVAVLAEGPAKSLACRRIGPLAAAAADQMKSVWEAKGVRAVVSPVEETKYWVLISGLPDKAAATRKSIELRRLGVKEFLVVTESVARQYAVSLGAFQAEDSAKEFLVQLNRKGVKSARIEPRAKAGDKALLELTGDADLLATLQIGLLPAGVGEVTDCPQK
jgi:SPOR domain